MANFSPIFMRENSLLKSSSAHFMLNTTYSAKLGYLFAVKYNILQEHCIVVTPSLFGNVTMVRILLSHKCYWSKIFCKKDEA